MLNDLIEWAPVSRVRRNHALEHATMNILMQKKATRPMLAGYSDRRGFWIVGQVDIQELQEAVDEALLRLKKGEYSLAISQNCGTNFVASGVLAGSTAWLAMLGSGNSFKRKLERWPLIVMLTTMVLIFSRPLGPVLQKRLTTEPRMGALKVKAITVFQDRSIPAHRITTEG